MDRRAFLRLGMAAATLPALPALPFQAEKSKLKITGVRLVTTRPKRPIPTFTPAPGSWSTSGVEVANPMSIYPQYKATRSLFQPDPGKLGGFTVEITTDKGVKGYGTGGIGGGQIVEQHFTKLLLNEDPFNVERIWDILWRSSMYYGRAGVVIMQSAAWIWPFGMLSATLLECRCTSCWEAPRRSAYPLTARGTIWSSTGSSDSNG